MKLQPYQQALIKFIESFPEDSEIRHYRLRGSIRWLAMGKDGSVRMFQYGRWVTIVESNDPNPKDTLLEAAKATLLPKPKKKIK